MWPFKKEICVDCDEDLFIWTCEYPTCTNMICSRHSWLQANKKHYCKECNKKHG